MAYIPQSKIPIPHPLNVICKSPASLNAYFSFFLTLFIDLKCYKNLPGS